MPGRFEFLHQFENEIVLRCYLLLVIFDDLYLERIILLLLLLEAGHYILQLQFAEKGVSLS